MGSGLGKERLYFPFKFNATVKQDTSSSYWAIETETSISCILYQANALERITKIIEKALQANIEDNVC